MANENRLCTLHIPRSALTPQTELLTSSPISPNNQAHPLQQKQEAIENKIKKWKGKCVCSVQIVKRQEKKFKNRKKCVCARYK